MRKNFKNQTNKIKKKDTNGITLIALVITIVLNCCEAAMELMLKNVNILNI